MFTFKFVQQPMFNTIFTPTVSQVWQPHNHLPIRFELQKNQFDRKLVILVQILSEDISEVRDVQSCLLLFVHVHFCKTLHPNLNSWLYFGLIEVKLKLFSVIELFAITEPKSIEFIDHSVLQSEIPLPPTSPKQIEWTLFYRFICVLKPSYWVHSHAWSKWEK